MDSFCLKWQHYESSLATAFQELRSDSELLDVTLGCEGGQLQAHRVVLSACSSFFREILRLNKHPHPFIYLRGVNFAEIVSILNFMYEGEVNVAQEKLNPFLLVAEELKVKGLSKYKSQIGVNHSDLRNLPNSGAPRPSFPYVILGPSRSIRTLYSFSLSLSQFQSTESTLLNMSDEEETDYSQTEGESEQSEEEVEDDVDDEEDQTEPESEEVEVERPHAPDTCRLRCRTRCRFPVNRPRS